MIRNLCVLLTLGIVLSSCASTQTTENAKQTRDNINQAMADAGKTPELEAVIPPDDILDDLVLDSGIAVPGLDDNVRQQIAFDISVSNAPARVFFMSLVRDTDVNMVVHPSVSGEISLDLKNVTVHEVMALTREVYGYEYKQSTKGFIVLPARIQSKIFAVNYLNIARQGESSMTVSSGQLADGNSDNNSDDNNTASNSTSSARSSSINTTIQSDFWADLHGTITSIVGGGDGRSVVVDRHAGLIIVRAMPAELRDVAAYLEDAQGSLQRQVILEAKIIEVKLSDSFQSGIDWAALSSSQEVLLGNTGLIDGSSQVLNDLGDLDTGAALSSSNNDFSNLFTIGGATDDFGALIRLLSTQGEVQVLSSPRISTVNNQKAVIKVGSDEFFVTDVSSNTSSTSIATTTSPDITLTPFFSGIALDVTPQISAEDEVILHIHPSVSEVIDQTKTITVGGQAQQLPLAFSTVRESDSVVKARNGQVVVIGGLMQNTSSNDDAGVPGAKDVPILGGLFKQTRAANTRSELVILLRPIVVKSDETWTDTIKDSATRIETLKYQDSEGE